MTKIYGYGIKFLELLLKIFSKGERSVLPNFIYDGYHWLNERKIEKDISEIFNKFQHSEAFYKNHEKTKTSDTVWVMWWQKDNVPDLVKHNINMMRKNLNKKVVVLNEENLANYLSIPESIYVGLSNGKVTFPSFSDYVRTGILFRYGGLWLDSTILVLNADNFINEADFITQKLITIKGVSEYGHKFAAQNRWTVYCIGGVAGQDIFKFVNCGIEHYLKDGLKIPTYFLIDYLFDMAYKRNLDGFQDKVSELKENNVGVERLASLINEKFDLNTYRNLTRESKVFKLSVKKNYNIETVHHDMTYFGYLRENGLV